MFYIENKLHCFGQTYQLQLIMNNEILLAYMCVFVLCVWCGVCMCGVCVVCVLCVCVWFVWGCVVCDYGVVCVVCVFGVCV